MVNFRFVELYFNMAFPFYRVNHPQNCHHVLTEYHHLHMEQNPPRQDQAQQMLSRSQIKRVLMKMKTLKTSKRRTRTLGVTAVVRGDVAEVAVHLKGKDQEVVTGINVVRDHAQKVKIGVGDLEVEVGTEKVA